MWLTSCHSVYSLVLVILLVLRLIGVEGGINPQTLDSVDSVILVSNL